VTGASTVRRPLVEWPTVAVAVAVYGGWLAVVLAHRSLPWPVALAALTVLIAWHGSLQHEALHGHPFRSPTANEVLGSVPVSLRLSFRVYRRSHLRHHACTDLTDPVVDPESFHVTAVTWRRVTPVGRMFLLAHHTLLGRMVLGPLVENGAMARRDLSEIRHGDGRLFRWWAGHLAATAVLLWLVVGVVGFPLWLYLAAVYTGNGLSLVRSFAEHRWNDTGDTRSAVVRADPFFRLLFLENTLHDTHHEQPGVPWYALSALADELGSDGRAEVGAGRYRGYGEVACRHLVRPFGHPVHPTERAAAGVAVP
jgi:fatty acid desaturase